MIKTLVVFGTILSVVFTQLVNLSTNFAGNYAPVNPIPNSECLPSQLVIANSTGPYTQGYKFTGKVFFDTEECFLEYVELSVYAANIKADFSEIDNGHFALHWSIYDWEESYKEVLSNYNLTSIYYIHNNSLVSTANYGQTQRNLNHHAFGVFNQVPLRFPTNFVGTYYLKDILTPNAVYEYPCYIPHHMIIEPTSANPTFYGQCDFSWNYNYNYTLIYQDQCQTTEQSGNATFCWDLEENDSEIFFNGFNQAYVGGKFDPNSATMTFTSNYDTLSTPLSSILQQVESSQRRLIFKN